MSTGLGPICTTLGSLTLIETIAQRLRQVERKPQPLYGVWKGKFSEDANIDEALQEIRIQWREESEESSK